MLRSLSRIKGGQPVLLAAVFAVLLFVAGCGGSSSSSNATATPSFSPSGGNYNTTQSVTIADTTSGAVLYCTTDGTQPTTSSPQCSEPTVISKSMYLQAIAVAPGKTASAVASAGFTIDLNTVPTPTFSPIGGTYTGAQPVTINDNDTAAQIYYSTDGSTPSPTSSTSALYTGQFTVSQSETLNAIAVRTGYANSGVATTSYVINYPAATPQISLAPGTYTSVQPVTITDSTPGATIYYTTDTSIPGPNNPSSKSGPSPVSVSVGTSETVAAVAVATGYSNSAVASATYTINLDAGVPTFAINGTTLGASTTVNGPATLTFNDTPANATIYYTLDNTTPSASHNGGSITPGNSITVNPPSTGTSVTVNADAVSASGVLSSMASVALNFQAVAPTFSVGGTPTTGGQYTLPLTVNINDTLSGATTYYYIGTTAPSTSDLSSWTQGSSATVSTPGTLWAMATGTGYAPSTPVSAAFYAQPTLMGTVSSGSAGAAAIKGAQVYLYHAGGNASNAAASAYGTGADLVATTPAGGVATGADGSFTLTYDADVCTSSQSSQNDQWFLVATGGTVVGGPDNNVANSNIALMAALGSCGNLGNTKSVVINEATTVASVWALQQFMKADNTIKGGLNIGTSEGNYQGLVNAFNTVGNLVNLTGSTDSGTGTAAGAPWAAPASTITSGWHTAAIGMTPAYAKGITPVIGTDGQLCSTSTDPTSDGCSTAYQPAQYMNDSTVPTARIDTLANVLASCVQMAANCSSLLQDVNTAQSGITLTANTVTAANTLQAAFNMAQNPGNNATALYRMQGVNNAPTPYSPMLSVTTPPVDMTIALTFTGGGLGGYPSDNKSGTGKAINAWGMDIDASGNIYATGSAPGHPTLSNYMLVKFNNLGTPLTPATTYTGTYSTGTYSYGGVTTNESYGGQEGKDPGPLALDSTSDAIYVTGGQTAPWIDEYNSSDLSFGKNLETNVGSLQTQFNNRGLTLDLFGDLWASFTTTSSHQAMLYEIPANSTTVNSYTPEGNAAGSSSLPLGSLIWDSKGNLWGADIQTQKILQLTAGFTANASALTLGYNQSNTQIMGADASGNIYYCNEDPNSYLSDMLSVTSASSLASQQPLATYTFTSATNPGSCGTALLADGDGYLWSVYPGLTANNSSDPSTAQGSLSRFIYDSSNETFTLLNPSAYTGTSTAESNILFTWQTSVLNFPGPMVAGAQIDRSGNIWVLGQNTGASNTTGLRGNILVEYVGIAAPLTTPISLATSNTGTGATVGGVGQRP